MKARFNFRPFGGRLKSGSVVCNATERDFSLARSFWRKSDTPILVLFKVSESLLRDPIAGKARRFITVARERLCNPTPERQFPSNRKTALCHSGSRNMTGLAGSEAAGARGRAREDIPTHRPTQKENVSPFNEDCSFPFALTFLGEGLFPCSPSNPRLSHQAKHGDMETTPVLWGPFLFLLLCFSFYSLSFTQLK